jgi:hypothetical protein
MPPQTSLVLRCVRAAGPNCKFEIVVPFANLAHHDTLGDYLRDRDWLCLLASPAGKPEVNFEAVCRPCAQIVAPETEEFLAGAKTPPVR